MKILSDGHIIGIRIPAHSEKALIIPVLSICSSPLEIPNWRKEKGEGIGLHPVK